MLTLWEEYGSSSCQHESAEVHGQLDHENSADFEIELSKFWEKTPQVDSMMEDCEDVREELNSSSLYFDNYKDEEFRSLIGAPSKEKFEELFSILNIEKKCNSRAKLFMAIFQLRQGISTAVVTALTRPRGQLTPQEFKWGKESTRRHINAVYKEIASIYSKVVKLPPPEDIKALNTPQGIQKDIPNVFMFADATYLYCQKPSTPLMNNLLYCHYKSRYCVKVMVLCAPDGRLFGLWGPFPGKWTDGQIMIQVLQNAESNKLPFWQWLCTMPEGATIGVDAGFPKLEDHLPKNIKVWILFRQHLFINIFFLQLAVPPKLRNGETHFTTEQTVSSRKVTRWRGVGMIPFSF